MKRTHLVVVSIVAIALLVGTAFAAELKGRVAAVDRTKRFLSVRNGSEKVEFECAPGTLTELVQKNAEVVVHYKEAAGKKTATKIDVHGGC